jgi:hypothetical protein
MGAKTHFQYYTKTRAIFQQKFTILINLNTFLIKKEPPKRLFLGLSSIL